MENYAFVSQNTARKLKDAQINDNNKGYVSILNIEKLFKYRRSSKTVLIGSYYEFLRNGIF